MIVKATPPFHDDDERIVSVIKTLVLVPSSASFCFATAAAVYDYCRKEDKLSFWEAICIKCMVFVALLFNIPYLLVVLDPLLHSALLSKSIPSFFNSRKFIA